MHLTFSIRLVDCFHNNNSPNLSTSNAYEPIVQTPCTRYSTIIVSSEIYLTEGSSGGASVAVTVATALPYARSPYESVACSQGYYQGVQVFFT